MLARIFKEVAPQRLLLLALLCSAILQPAHQTSHRVQSDLAHALPTVLSIGNSAALASFIKHKEQHGKELCGQCQLGFMGEFDLLSTSLATDYAIHFFDATDDIAVVDVNRLSVRNRGPPLS